jgi:hypothetical protein
LRRSFKDEKRGYTLLMILATGFEAIAALSLAAALAYAVSAAGASRLGDRGASVALGAAWLLHLAAIALSLLAASPRFGFAPALSMTVWLVVTVYAIEKQMFPQLAARWAFGLGCAIAVLLPVAFPGEPLHLASALGPLHLALGVASYGLFAAAAVHAWLMMRAEQQIRAGADAQAGLPRCSRASSSASTLVPGAGTTRRSSPSSPGSCSPASCWGARASAGAGARPFACFTRARCCFCSRMSARASCSR